MQRVVFISFFLLLAFPALSQLRPVLNQQHFTTDDGLPQSMITGILEDEDGFIWISTKGGIARYDGRSFKTISKKETGKQSFRSQVIDRMVYNQDQHITLLYQGGHIDDFDPVHFTVKPITGDKIKLPPVSQGLAPGDSSNNFLNFAVRPGIGRGIDWTEPGTGRQIHAGRSNGTLQNDTIIGITTSPDGEITIITPSGLEQSGDGGKSFRQTPFRIPFDSTTFLFKDVLYMPGGTIVTRYKNSLLRIDPAERSVSLVRTPATDQSQTVRVTQFALDHQQRLYFIQQGSVYRVEKDGQLKKLWTSNFPRQLNITACYIDRNDVLWVSPNAQGLIKVDLVGDSFESFTYSNGFFPDVLEKSGVQTAFLPSFWFTNKLLYNFYSAWDKDSCLYLCYGQTDGTTINGPNILALDKGEIRPLIFPAGKTPGFRGVSITEQGGIWVADINNQGLWFWENRRAHPVFHPFDTTLAIQAIADIRAREEKVWISTHGRGLFVFENNRLHKIPAENGTGRILSDNLTDICINPANLSQLWIGSRGEGLILFDPEKGVQKTFGTDQGLPDNTIYCIVADKTGMLWLSTNRGICRFNPVNFSSSYYLKSDGLAGNEFNRYHKFLFRDQSIAFGGLDGFSVFSPLAFNGIKKPLAVPLKITDIWINNAAQNFNEEESLVKQPFTKLKELRLPYNKNYVSVGFAALQFNEPLKIKYRYRLKGIEEEWHESGTNNIATYTQLRPGSYMLEMNATDRNGIWSPQILELAITVRSPLWANTWAYLFYALLIAFAVHLYFRHQKKRLKEQQQLAYEQKEAERLKELDTIKDRFFSNITHEFRTPLTLMLAPLEKLQKETSLNASANATLQTISGNARQLLQLVNELLDFSKLDKGQMKINLSHGEPDSFVAQLVRGFSASVEEKNIQLKYSSENAVGLFAFDQEKWTRILFNLLSNALKFTKTGGEISVKLTGKTDYLMELQVQDNGIGIPPEQIPYIFDRFFQVDSSHTRSYQGTGIGLALVKELVNILKGSIQVESAPGVGSCFTILLPVQKIPVSTPQPASDAANDSGQPESGAPTTTLKAEKPLLLVVEDNHELRAFLVEALSNDWNVLAAENGLQGKDLILTEMPSLIICDMMMPGLDGIELCRLCKSDPRTAHIGFILLTARAGQETKLLGLETGADDYITKPFHLDELFLRINNLLQLKDRQRQFLQSQMLPKTPVKTLPGVNDVFLRQLYQVLDHHLESSSLNVDFLARNLAMSRSSLNRKLKSLLDISANDLIRQYRLQKATALLAAGHDISSTAYKVGFNTPSYFTQCFKEQYGLTPSDYLSTGSVNLP